MIIPVLLGIAAVLFIIGILLINACSSMRITHDYDKTVDFNQFTLKNLLLRTQLQFYAE